MTNQQALEKSLTHLEELIKLTEGNVYQDFIYSKLISIELELKRQLSLIKNGQKVL
jgi:hypothetical protein